MVKPTVVAPGEDIAPQDAATAAEAPAAPTLKEGTHHTRLFRGTSTNGMNQ